MNHGEEMKVYMTKRCSDMTEGRGSMVNDLCFASREHAEQHIDTKHGDWCIEEISVLGHSVIDAEEERKRIAKKALRKLTYHEHLGWM